MKGKIGIAGILTERPWEVKKIETAGKIKRGGSPSDHENRGSLPPLDEKKRRGSGHYPELFLLLGQRPSEIIIAQNRNDSPVNRSINRSI